MKLRISDQRVHQFNAMYFVIFDLEATCWEGNTLGRQQEIIEIGALICNLYGDQVAGFKQFVRPVMNPGLSFYCTQLTGITQADVDRARPFGRIGAAFEEWIYQHADEFVLCSWGGKDLELLESDCYRHGMDTDWLGNYIDLKEQYHKIKGIHRKRGLRKSLAKEGLDFEGDHHRAYDDAANLYRLFVKYRDCWMY